MKIRTNCLLLLVCVPLFAHAQAYKCKQPNGSVSFQDQPCPTGATSSTINLPQQAPANVVPPTSPTKLPKQPKVIVVGDPGQNKEIDAQRRRIEEENAARNKEVQAYNKMQRCNYARQQLGVLREAKPVFSRDNKGDRQYVADENRPAEISAAERRVAEECK